MKQILHNNKYDISILNKFNNAENKFKQDTRKTKWAKFTYNSKETKFITSTALKIAFTTKNNIGKQLSIQYNHNQNNLDKCGFCQLTCPDCSI